jgi:hypothetical protein
VTFLAEPRRARVITAKLITYLLAGAGNGNLAVLGAVIISVAVFGVTSAGLGTLLGGEVGTMPAHELHAVGLDLPAVDRGLLVCFADSRQVREEVRPVGDRPDVEPCLKFAEDLPPGMQAFGLGPGP